MKVVIPGGTGHLGRVLSRRLGERGDEVVVLTRRETTPEPGVRHVRWDGRSAGPWTAEIDGSDVVLNLAGRSVNCRYTPANLREMWNSRVDSARVVGGAIERATRPPRVWLQMSTATIYAHRFDAPNDEATGVLGGDEPGVPGYWAYSVDLARAWEREQEVATTPRTRKVALRTAMVMSPEPGGAFAMLLRLTRLGLGGPVAGGAQYLSWIHEDDLVRAIDFLVARDDLSGPVNLAAPEPLPYRDFLRSLRAAAGVPLGLPATRWMAEIGAFVLRSDTELLLKSRRVVPGRMLDAGFAFEHPEWPAAAADLLRRPVRAAG
ncbi:TIGR01777 family oxidoreductase [Amycolatopsis mongoliensis]|uniref:TIGR01777 family oxidoreductase n=1 Tax=Amycolatopsis mongoliensis TaxID=715475 RepID=A0A9Y2NCE4_9PSEU|nr:TIGR01777 family oxidoreductase [Amycolatopsis sp. 4-36]WIX99506.1 TIGR01777 family oxidoreductase [Amycolatopsis sp. 4-36]